jgi:cytochrome c-type biogenesis protein CcmH
VTRLLSYVAMAIVLAVALSIGVFGGQTPQTFDQHVAEVARTIRCPQCRSQSANDSEAPTAAAVRREIARRIDAGESDDQIRTYFAGRYGDEILLRPPASGAGAFVWIIPTVTIVLGGAGLAVAFRRWRTWT